MSRRNKFTTQGRVLFHFSLRKKETREIFEEIKSRLMGAWKSMQNHSSSKGEVFYNIPVNRGCDERISNADEMIVELEFSDRGVEFEKDLVKALGVSLHGRWGRNIHVRFKRGAGKG